MGEAAALRLRVATGVRRAARPLAGHRAPSPPHPLKPLAPNPLRIPSANPDAYAFQPENTLKLKKWAPEKAGGAKDTTLLDLIPFLTVGVHWLERGRLACMESKARALATQLNQLDELPLTPALRRSARQSPAQMVAERVPDVRAVVKAYDGEDDIAAAFKERMSHVAAGGGRRKGGLLAGGAAPAPAGAGAAPPASSPPLRRPPPAATCDMRSLKAAAMSSSPSYAFTTARTSGTRSATICAGDWRAERRSAGVRGSSSSWFS